MCIIAPSFADIFKNNTFQNGMLPVILPEKQCQELAAEAEQGLELEVDLEKQEVRRASGKPAFPFTVLQDLLETQTIGSCSHVFSWIEAHAGIIPAAAN